MKNCENGSGTNAHRLNRDIWTRANESEKKRKREEGKYLSLFIFRFSSPKYRAFFAIIWKCASGGDEKFKKLIYWKKSFVLSRKWWLPLVSFEFFFMPAYASFDVPMVTLPSYPHYPLCETFDSRHPSLEIILFPSYHHRSLVLTQNMLQTWEQIILCIIFSVA